MWPAGLIASTASDVKYKDLFSRPFDAACSVFTQDAKPPRKGEFKNFYHEEQESTNGGELDIQSGEICEICG